MGIIETTKLRRTFKGRSGTVDAVQGGDLQVQQGEIFGFLGPNGAGKTTTMRMLSTLLEPTGGDARVCNFDLLKQAPQIRTQIGYVGQQGGTIPTDTARENLILQGQLYGMKTSDAKSRAADLIKRLDLEPFADRLSQSYSGGQKRRLDMAMGIMHLPKLLFLDEPTTGLDPQSRARVWDEVKELNAQGMTIFLTTHYLDEADALCNRLAIIDGGKIVSEGTPDALKRQIAGDIISVGFDTNNGALDRAGDLLRAQAYVRELVPAGDQVQVYVDKGEESLPSVLRLLDSASIPLRTITLSRPTLDDVFLRLTGRSLREVESK